MTHKTNRYGIYEVDHTKFGGLIFPSDFNTDNQGKNNYNGSQIAIRIEADRQREEKLWEKERNNKERVKSYGK